MLDIKLVRENSGAIQADLKKRGDKEKLAWLDELADLDRKWRQAKFDFQTIQHRKNEISREIAESRKKGKDISKQLKELKDIPEKITAFGAELEGFEKRIRHYLMSLPNILHESVPIGRGDAENVLIREWGRKPEFGFKPKSHTDLLEGLGIADIERAGRVSGARFYYLKDELVLLDMALQKFALDFLREKGFTLISPPPMMRGDAYRGVTSLQDFEDVMYKIEGEDLYLIATSEHPLAAMFIGETLDSDTLPLKFAGVSPCFRKEAGAHGRDTKGIFRVHNFNKVEQFIFCRPEDSWRLHEDLLKNSEQLLQKLGLPYRVVNVCTGDIGSIAAKKYDIEVWFPVQNAYREAMSCSNCTDYQARRLNIRHGKEGGDKQLVHTLNNTALATSRIMVAILENFQNKDGTVNIPKILQPYMNNIRKIMKK